MENKKQSDKNIQGMFENYQPEIDTDAVWENIEPKLKKKNRRFFLFYLILGVGLMTTGYVYFNNNDIAETPLVQVTENQSIAPEEVDESVTEIVESDLAVTAQTSNTVAKPAPVENSIASQRNDLFTNETTTIIGSNTGIFENFIQPEVPIIAELENEYEVEKEEQPVSINDTPDLAKRSSFQNKTEEKKRPDNPIAEVDQEVEKESFNPIQKGEYIDITNRKRVKKAKKEKPIKIKAPKKERIKKVKKPKAKKKAKKKKQPTEKLAWVKKAKKKKVKKAKKKKLKKRRIKRMKRTPFRPYVQVFAAPEYAFRSISTPGSEGLSNWVNMRNSTEQQLEAFSYGANLQLVHKNGFVMMAGGEFRRINGRYKQVEIEERTVFENGIISYTVNSAGDTIDVGYGLKEKLVTTERTQTAQNNFQFLNVPIGLGYQHLGRNGGWKILGGLNLNIAYYMEASYLNRLGNLIPYDNKKDRWRTTEFKQKANANLWASFEYFRKIRPKVQWMIAPKIEVPTGGLTNLDAYPISQRFYPISLKTGFNFLLGKAPKKKKKDKKRKKKK